MKILVVGDQHFRLDLPYADHVKDRREGEKKEVFNTIHAAAVTCDAVVLVGDNLHARHNHSSVIREYINFLKGFGDKPLYIISGNHEVYNGTDTAIDFLRDLNIPNWHVMTSPLMVELERNIFAWFVPYMTNAALEATSNEEATEKLMKKILPTGSVQQTMLPVNLLFHHHAVSGTKTLGAMTDLFNEIVLPRDELEKRFDLSVGGHIHQPSYSGKTIVTGCVFTSEMGEEKKSVWVVDVKNAHVGDKETKVNVTEIPLPVRPLIKAVVTKAMSLAEYPTNAIFKATVTDPRMKGEGVEFLRNEILPRFDGFILVEDYPNERVKTRIDEGAGDDMSVEALLKSYAKQKGTPEAEILEAFELIR